MNGLSWQPHCLAKRCRDCWKHDRLCLVQNQLHLQTRAKPPTQHKTKTQGQSKQRQSQTLQSSWSAASFHFQFGVWLKKHCCMLAHWNRLRLSSGKNCVVLMLFPENRWWRNSSYIELFEICNALRDVNSFDHVRGHVVNTCMTIKFRIPHASATKPFPTNSNLSHQNVFQITHNTTLHISICNTPVNNSMHEHTTHSFMSVDACDCVCVCNCIYCCELFDCGVGGESSRRIISKGDRPTLPTSKQSGQTKQSKWTMNKHPDKLTTNYVFSPQIVEIECGFNQP